MTLICAAAYLAHYFFIYPAESAVAFENYDFAATFDEALRRAPTRIVLSDAGNVPYINLRFFGSLRGTHVRLVVGSRRGLQPGDLYIGYRPSTNVPGGHPASMYLIEP